MTKNKKDIKRYNTKKTRLLYLTAAITILTVEVLIALFVHDAFVRPYLGDVLAVMVVYCAARAALRRTPGLLALYVFLFAAAVELSQLLGLARLLGVSGGPFGIILGGVFDWADVAMYLVGCAVMFGVQLMESRRERSKTCKKHPLAP